jgi:hypothetical protein
MLVRLHSVDEAKTHEDRQELVDDWIRDSDDNPTAWPKHPATLARDALLIADMLDRGQENNRIEGSVGKWERLLKGLAPQLVIGCDQGVAQKRVDTDALAGSLPKRREELPLRAADVENSGALPHPSTGNPHTPFLENAIKWFHLHHAA